MFWYGNETIQGKSTKILNRMREIKRNNTLTVAEQAELTDLEKELDAVRKDCVHFYSVVLLFNRHRRFCTWCDKEDHSYIHT